MGFILAFKGLSVCLEMRLGNAGLRFCIVSGCRPGFLTPITLVCVCVCSFALFTVDHLSKYLAMRLTLDLDSELPETYRLLNFCIYIAPTPGQLVVLSGNQTLRQVNDKFWKVNKPLEMFYSWKKS